MVTKSSNSFISRVRGNVPTISSSVEIIGEDESYGAQARPQKAREILCRMMIETDTPAEFAFAIREFGTASVSMTPGIADSALISPPTPVAQSASQPVVAPRPRRRLMTWLLTSVLLYIVIPVAVAQWWRRALLARGEGALDAVLAKIGPGSIAALLATLVLLFAFQGEAILKQPLVIAMLAVPILIQVLFKDRKSVV